MGWANHGRPNRDASEEGRKSERHKILVFQRCRVLAGQGVVVELPRVEASEGLWTSGSSVLMIEKPKGYERVAGAGCESG